MESCIQGGLSIGRVPVVGELDLEAATDRSVGFTGADVEATVLAALKR